jgi:hypothetical protein
MRRREGRGKRYLQTQRQQSQDSMTRLFAASFEIQELAFMALERFRHGLLGLLVDEFGNIEGSGSR